MFGSKVLPLPHQVLHISKPTFSPFFPRAHILHISASLTSTQFLSDPRKSRWFIILPGVNFTCPFDAIQHRCYEKLLLSAAELKLIPAKKCHLFGGDKNRGLSHLKRNVNPWIMRIKRWLINVKSCTLIQGGGGHWVTNPAGRDASYHCQPSAFHCIWSRCIWNVHIWKIIKQSLKYCHHPSGCKILPGSLKALKNCHHHLKEPDNSNILPPCRLQNHLVIKSLIYENFNFVL